MSVHREGTTATVSSGAWSANTSKIIGGRVGLVYVKPLSGSTQFDFSLTDDGGRVIYFQDDWVGVLRDFTPFVVQGFLTMAIANSSADEAFEVLLMMEEV